MELTKLQKFWLEQLKKHPMRQARGSLGYKEGRRYKACCLGELHLCHFRLMKMKLPFREGNIVDGGTTYLTISHSKYGLKSHGGRLSKRVTIKGSEYGSLAEMNDGSMSWPEIAKFIEENPELVFNKE